MTMRRPHPTDGARSAAVALAATCLLVAAAFDLSATDAMEDERTVDTVVFVGERISIEPMADPCEVEAKQTGQVRCIAMDALYRATYRVVQPVVGQPGAEVTFELADHHGFPHFALSSHALLFVAIDKDRNWLHKYQGYPMLRSVDGRWAACGEFIHPGVDNSLLHRVTPLVFAVPVATKSAFPKEEWEYLLPRWSAQRDTYRIEDDQVHCLRGVPVETVYEIVRQGVMAAREVPLPPLPAGH